MRTIRPVIAGSVIAIAFFLYTSLRLGAPAAFVRHDPVEITQAAGPQTFDSEEQNNIQVYKRALPSVVNITSRTLAFDFFYGAVPQEGAGSGFIIDREGHILTNYHVIQDAQRLEVTLYNKKKYPATVVGADPSHDLAIIQIKGVGLTPAVLGDSHGLEVGQKVYAIGNPFGLAGTMTRGIVSSIRQVSESSGATIDEAIQTDAAINPGNSGGPMLNSRGEVVGINTLILSASGSSSGIGFAIPINAAKAAINDLVQYGRVRRPALGIVPLPIGPELAQQLGLASDNGVLIQRVVSNGSADRAGLKGGTERAYLGNTPIMVGGDLIVAINGDPVEDLQDYSHVMNNHRADDVITVTVFRGKKKMDVRVTLEEATGANSRS